MNNIKKIIMYIIIIIIILIIILIVLLKRQSNNNQNEIISIEDNGEELVKEQDVNGYKEVDDNSIYYSVVNIINQYIELIKYNENFNIEDEVEDSTEENQNLKIIYEFLDNNYIRKNNISINNIQDYIYEVTTNTIFIPMNMKVKYGLNCNIYILQSYLVDDDIKEKYFVIRMDNKNQTFSLEFINQKIDDIEHIKIEDNDKNISKNNSNNFEIEMIDDGKMAQIYLQHYRDLSLVYPELIYNEYLDDEYKKNRFGSFENYKEYIDKNIDELQNIETVKYSTEITDNNNINYICIDQYQNTYIFTVSGILKYKIKLDTYTLTSDKFISTYNNSDNQIKVQMNIDKFFMMLNNRDYVSAYNLLENDYNNQNFENEEKFEQYIRNGLPSHYKIKYNSFEQIGNDKYVQNITLLDIMNNDEEYLNIDMIIELEEEMKFKVLFMIE